MLFIPSCSTVLVHSASLGYNGLYAESIGIIAFIKGAPEMQQPITLSAQYSQSTKKKQAWGALRGVALLFKVLAWIAATSGCIVAVVGIVVGATTHPTAVKSGTLAIGLGSSPMLG